MRFVKTDITTGILLINYGRPGKKLQCMIKIKTGVIFVTILDIGVTKNAKSGIPKFKNQVIKN